MSALSLGFQRVKVIALSILEGEGIGNATCVIDMMLRFVFERKDL
jgi:hypothetical protein